VGVRANACTKFNVRKSKSGPGLLGLVRVVTDRRTDRITIASTHLGLRTVARKNYSLSNYNLP